MRSTPSRWALQVTGQYFGLANNGCAAGVPAGGTCQIAMSFAPLAAGKKFTGKMAFSDQSKNSKHVVKLDGKAFGTPAPTPTATVTATATGTPTATPSSTPTFVLGSVAESAGASVYLDSATRGNVVQTSQATATATPSFAATVSVSDANVDMAGSAQSTQTSSADSSTITVNATANMLSDISACVGNAELCFEQN